jgi:hypothetical protein
MIEDAQPEAVADIYYSGMILTGRRIAVEGNQGALADRV